MLWLCLLGVKLIFIVCINNISFQYYHQHQRTTNAADGDDDAAAGETTTWGNLYHRGLEAIVSDQQSDGAAFEDPSFETSPGKKQQQYNDENNRTNVANHVSIRSTRTRDVVASLSTASYIRGVKVESAVPQSQAELGQLVHSLGSPRRGVLSGRNLQTQTWTRLGADIDGEAAGDYSGRTVSLSDDGTVLAIGALSNDGNGANSGHVRVYKYANNAWTKLGNDIDGEAAGDEFGFFVNLSSDGTILAVGGRKNDGSGRTDGGHVRVFQYASNAWTQLGSDIDGEAAGDSTGCSVSLSSDGTVLAVGAQLNDGSATDAGHVRVFKYANNNWAQLGNDIDGEGTNQQFGWTVSLSSDGTVLAVGAHYNPNGGRIRVFKYNANVWTQLGNSINGEAVGDAFGFSVSLSGDGTVVAGGAIWNNGAAGAASGHARVFQYINNAWTQLGSDIDGEVAHDNFGVSVNLSSDGSVVAIGSSWNDGSFNDAGHVRVYKYNGSAWTKIGSDIDGEAAGDLSGFQTSLSSDGTILAIGAYSNDGSGLDSGHVRVYKLSGGPTPNPTSRPPSSNPTFQPTALPSRQPTFSPSRQPSFQPSALPSRQPTFSPFRQPSFQPTSHPTNQPTSSPSSSQQSSLSQNTGPNSSQTTTTGSPTSTEAMSPTYLALPFLGGCPAEVSEYMVVYYEPGDRVSNNKIIFQCKSWPNSLFCSQVAFYPDLASKTEYWRQAWEVVGRCADLAMPPSDGCPPAWSAGDISKYKENDQVSVMKNKVPLVQAVYKCKAWPFSWHCGQHNPLDYSGGKLGWEYLGECVGTIMPTNTPTLAPDTTVVIDGCPSDYNSLSSHHVIYKAGDQVAVASASAFLSRKVVYACREFPFSGFCNQKGFAPGEQYDYIAWTVLGPCDGTLAPTNAPTAYLGGACTYLKVDTSSPTSTPVITPVLSWSGSILYNAGDQVRIGIKKFQCKPWPFYFWCRVPAYAPTLAEAGLWTEAWFPAGTCPP